MEILILSTELSQTCKINVNSDDTIIYSFNFKFF